MKIMISISHPAWVHQFHNILKQMIARGDEVLVVAIQKDGDLLLLEHYQIPYKLIGKTTGRGKIQKGLLFILQCIKHSFYALRFRPDVLIGRCSPMLAVAAAIVRKKHIIYEDTEAVKFSLNVCKRFSYKIITSTSFELELGRKQKRVDTYKELFYLHPNYFSPSKEIVRKNGINPDEPYIVLRFVAWNAIHDIGHQGISQELMEQMVEELSAYGKVYISSEKALVPKLLPYQLKSQFQDIHHILAFAHLYIGEGASMASESAVLGTHAIYVNSISCGSTNELHNRYGLMDCYNSSEGNRYQEALKRALELLQDPNLKAKEKEKARKMLVEKIDINEFYIKQVDDAVKG